MAKKSPRKKSKPTNPAHVNTLPAVVVERLAEVDGLIDDGRLHEARQLLLDLERMHPNQALVFQYLSQVATQLDDEDNQLRAAEGLARLAPDDPDLMFAAGVLYNSQGLSALALETLHKARDLAMRQGREEISDSATVDIVTAIQLAEKMVAGSQEHYEFPGPEGYAALLEFDRCMLSIYLGHMSSGREAALALLRRYPHLHVLHNIVGTSYYVEGRLDEAVARVREVPSGGPDYCRSRTHLVHWEVLRSNAAEVSAAAEILRGYIDDPKVDRFTLAKALIMAGDDRSVLELASRAVAERASQAATDPFHQEDRNRERDSVGDDLEMIHAAGVNKELERAASEIATEESNAQYANILNLGAVSACRMGRVEEARELWRHAIAAQPEHAIAKQNLEDLDRNRDDQHGPTPFPLFEWLPLGVMREISDFCQFTAGDPTMEAIERRARKLIRKFPWLVQAATTLISQLTPNDTMLLYHVVIDGAASEAAPMIEALLMGTRGSRDFRAGLKWALLRKAGLIVDPDEA